MHHSQPLDLTLVYLERGLVRVMFRVMVRFRFRVRVRFRV